MGGRAEPALLERELDLAALGSALEDARRGGGRVVVIEGPAGIGKTRLLTEARRAAAAAGMRVLAARGSELERGFPFALVRQLFEPELAALAPAERHELLAGSARPAGPVLGVGGASPDADSPAAPSFVTLNALYWLTSNLVENRPALLAVDDAHWSDSPSLRFFRFLAPRLEDLAVVLALAARPAEAESELLSGLLADPGADVIRPRGLSSAAVADLVRAALSDDAHDDFCIACHAVTRGNPFMLRELLGELASEGSRGGAAEAARVREVAPTTIKRAVLVRLARLPDPASELAHAVAILGDGVALADAAELAGVDRVAAAAAADDLMAAGVLEHARPLRFVHPLVRTAVYTDLPGAAKASAHRRAAALLSSRGAAPERIAAHLVATDPTDDPAVAGILGAAARRALDRAAPEPAVAYLRRALAEQPPPDLRLDLLRMLVRAYVHAGDRPGFDELRDSGAFEELIAEPQRLLQSAAEFARLLYNWGRIEDVHALLNRATAAAVKVGDADLAGRFQALLAFWTLLPPAEALTRLERFGANIRPDSPTERVYLVLRAFWSLLTGAPREAVIATAHRAIQSEAVWHEARNLAGLVPWVLRRAGDLDGAERALAQQLSTLGPTSLASQYAGFDRGELALIRGQVADAEAEARISVRRIHQAGSPLRWPPYFVLLVEVLLERDDLAGAEAELERSGLANAPPDHSWFLPLRVSFAQLLLAEHKPRAALHELLELRDRAAKAGIRLEYSPIGSYLAQALRGIGDHAEAQAVATRELADARAWGLPRRIAIAMRTLGLLKGGDGGLEMLRDSVSILDPSTDGLEHMRSLTEYGAALRRANRRAEARDPLHTALETSRRAGAMAIAKRAHQELEATGEKVRPLLAGGVESLTASERRVAALAAEGQSNRQIAQSLFLSVKTVEGHLSHAYRKLDVTSRGELARALATQRPA